MDPESTKDVWWLVSQIWPAGVVALAVYGGGLTANRVALIFVPAAKDYLAGKTTDLDPKWPLLFRLWAATRYAHPFFVGASFAFIPGFPHPEFVSSTTSAALWLGGAGMLNGQVAMMVEAGGGQIMKVISSLAPAIRARLGLPTQTITPVPPAPTHGTDPSPSTETDLDAADAEREAMEAEVVVKVGRSKPPSA